MQKIELSSNEVWQAAHDVADSIMDGGFSVKSPPLKIYGVPRGGIPVAFMVKEALDRIPRLTLDTEVVFSPEYADVIVDDIIDSGATKARFKGKPFYALIDKNFDGKEWFVFPWERNEQEGTGAEDIVTRLIQFVGEDPKRKGLIETPKRVVRAWEHLYSGYRVEPKTLFKVFDEPCDEMVIVRNIEFYSMCEHHLLPFFGKAHIAYIPNGNVVGVSKLARLVDCFARRMQIQERLTQQITEAIEEGLSPLGTACFIEAQHLCMMARGVEKQNSVMVTSSLRGVFKEKDSTRVEFLLLNGRGGIHG